MINLLQTTYLDPGIVSAESSLCATIHWGYTCVFWFVLQAPHFFLICRGYYACVFCFAASATFLSCACEFLCFCLLNFVSLVVGVWTISCTGAPLTCCLGAPLTCSLGAPLTCWLGEPLPCWLVLCALFVSCCVFVRNLFVRTLKGCTAYMLTGCTAYMLTGRTASMLTGFVRNVCFVW